jgi:hypothetical protein
MLLHSMISRSKCKTIWGRRAGHETSHLELVPLEVWCRVCEGGRTGGGGGGEGEERGMGRRGCVYLDRVHCNVAAEAEFEIGSQYRLD